MSKSWRPYAQHILVHNYLGNIDPITVASVIDQHLRPLEECIPAQCCLTKVLRIHRYRRDICRPAVRCDGRS